MKPIVDCVDCVYARPRPKKGGDKRPCPSSVDNGIDFVNKHGLGLCRRHSAGSTLAQASHAIGGFPIVFNDDGCGEGSTEEQERAVREALKVEEK